MNKVVLKGILVLFAKGGCRQARLLARTPAPTASLGEGRTTATGAKAGIDQPVFIITESNARSAERAKSLKYIISTEIMRIMTPQICARYALHTTNIGTADIAS